MTPALSVDPLIPRHSPECMCSTCERLGLGNFAQRAALGGDAVAASRLSAPVRAVLLTQRRLKGVTP